jgi:hypothetical protein
MISKLYLGRLVMYYSCHCIDLGREIPVESAISKLFAADSLMETALEAIQCMGGNGALKIYPVQRIMQDAKLTQIAAGTSEVLKLLIYRQGTKRLKDDLKIPQRMIDPDLKVPLPVGQPPARTKARSEADVLQILAENYRVNPGLHMTMDDIREWLEITDADLIKYLEILEAAGKAGPHPPGHCSGQSDPGRTSTGSSSGVLSIYPRMGKSGRYVLTSLFTVPYQT